MAYRVLTKASRTTPTGPQHVCLIRRPLQAVVALSGERTISTQPTSLRPFRPRRRQMRSARGGPSWTPGGGASQNAIGETASGYSPYTFPGDILICDVDVPPIACYGHPGLTIKREPGSNALHGAGGWFHSVNAAGSIAFVLDGDWQNPFGTIEFFNAHDRFFGVLDTGLVVVMPSIGGAENGACFSYPPCRLTMIRV